MVEFFLLLNFALLIVILCLCISNLRSCDNNTDLLLDHHKILRRIEKFYLKRHKK